MIDARSQGGYFGTDQSVSIVSDHAGYLKGETRGALLMTQRLPRYGLFSRTSSPFYAVAATLALLAAVGCGRHGKESPKGGTDVPPSQAKIKRNVSLTPVREEKLNSFVDTVGYLEAEGQTDIAAGVSGVVDEVLFRQGQY